MNWSPTVESCDTYLANRTGCYEYRRIRYNAAIEAMKVVGLEDTDTVVDVGAGWTEFDFCIRAEHNWRGRYIPVDGGIDGTDLNNWLPPRKADWFVALEIIEHLRWPTTFLSKLKDYANKGIIVSTPNPRTTDVLGMDPTHVSIIYPSALMMEGFRVEERSFYGAENDSLFGVWTND